MFVSRSLRAAVNSPLSKAIGNQVASKVIKPTLRSVTTTTARIHRSSSKKSLGYLLLGTAISTSALGLRTQPAIENDSSAPLNPESLISVDSSVDSFPKLTKEPLLETEFKLLGYGIRAVTFLKMKVYALGLYVAQDDIPLVTKILDSNYLQYLYESKFPGDNHKQHLENALKDKEMSIILVDNLLNSGVRFTARIVPVRNTDFNHLRDGLIKSIKSNPKYKELIRAEDGSDERIAFGLDQLRAAFGSNKVTAFKNSTMVMELVEGGKMKISFQQYSNKGEFKEPFVMGIVDEPLVGRLLFLSYLSGDKPLSEAARSKAIEGFVDIA